jgi:NAD(P)-dependent dehydrogenase (short-subunit alcohol dehydrogenase family)
MKNRVCVITGATSGVGRATAFELAERGARIVLIGRNTRRGIKAAEAIRRAYGEQAADFFTLDLSDPIQIEATAKTLVSRYPVIDVLVNNAGARNDTYISGRNGHELTFACNHLGHFLLTCLLLDRLLMAPAARIVTVSSGNHGSVPSDGQWELARHAYNRREAYARSKMANIVFASALASRLEHTRVVSNIYEPGGVASGFARNNGLISWGRHLLSHAMRRDLVSPKTAAADLANLASDDSLAAVTGRYFRREKNLAPLNTLHTPEAAKALWRLSIALLNVNARLGGQTWQIVQP